MKRRKKISPSIYLEENQRTQEEINKTKQLNLIPTQSNKNLILTSILKTSNNDHSIIYILPIKRILIIKNIIIKQNLNRKSLETLER